MRAAGCGDGTIATCSMPAQRDVGDEAALADHEAAVLAHAAVGRDEAESALRAHGVRRRHGSGRACARPRARSPRRSARSRCSGRCCRRWPRRCRRASAPDCRRSSACAARIIAGRAVAALHAVGLAERVLDHAELARRGRQPLDGGDGVAVGLHREHQAGAHRLAVDQHRAGAADAVLAAGMGAGEQRDRRAGSRAGSCAARPRPCAAAR